MMDAQHIKTVERQEGVGSPAKQKMLVGASPKVKVDVSRVTKANAHLSSSTSRAWKEALATAMLLGLATGLEVRLAGSLLGVSISASLFVRDST